MKQTVLLLVSFIILGISGLQAQRNCGSMEHLANQLEQNPEFQKNLDNLEKYTQKFVQENRELSNGVVTIPVIVHVVYKTSQQNISDAQVYSQIDVLNDDFRRTNEDSWKTPPLFEPLAADTEIEFCLTDITRTQTSVDNHGTNNSVKSASSGGVDVVNPSQMLNIWICSIGGGILGYAQFPGGPANTDGVVLDYRYTGTTGTATYPFHLGRTGTHEVGHWLNLRHIWGDGGCNVDDSVSDTPSAGGPNYTGAPCTFPGPNSCKPKGKPGQPDDPDMFQNYMDYSDDECMNLYTAGQKSRMWAALNGSRSSFLAAACDGTPPPPTEICNNGIDDDNNGLTDCDDPACSSDPSCVDPGTCDAPTNLQHTRRKGGNEALLSWNSVPTATGYYVEVYDGATLFASGNVTGTSAVLSGTTKNKLYTWQVRANCLNATSDWATSSFNAKLDGNFDDVWEELSVMPNPGTDLVQVQWDLPLAKSIKALENVVIADFNTLYTVELRSLSGQVLIQEEVQNEQNMMLNISDINQGVYIIRVHNQDGQQSSLKFVKI